MAKAKAAKVIFRRIRGRLIPIRVSKAKSKRDIGEQLNRIKAKKKSLLRLDKKVEKEFGFTNIPEDAGFIDRNRKMIDLSGRNQGNIYGGRVRDHREIDTVYQSPSLTGDEMGFRSLNLFHFMHDTKSIRISDHGRVFNVDMPSKPNKMQTALLRAITKGKSIYADVTSRKGETIASGEFDTIQEAIEKLFGGS